MEIYFFGAWTLAVFLGGFWIGRRSKWEEKNNVEPSIAAGVHTFTDPASQVIEDRMKPHSLEED